MFESLRRKLSTVTVFGGATTVTLTKIGSDYAGPEISLKAKALNQIEANLIAEQARSENKPYEVSSGIFGPVKSIAEKHIGRGHFPGKTNFDLTGHADKIPLIVAEIDKYFFIKLELAAAQEAQDLLGLAILVEKKVLGTKK